MAYYFNATDSKAHGDIVTVHEDADCHHLSDAERVAGVRAVPEDASVCETCGDPEPSE